VHPKLVAEWRLPLSREEQESRQVIEPIVMGVITPRGNNSDKIPNEDSQDFEFDDTNVLKDDPAAVWNNSGYQWFRQMFHMGILPTNCRLCAMAYGVIC